MKIKGLTPILNVSNMTETFEWFTKLGWHKGWDWCAASIPGRDKAGGPSCAYEWRKRVHPSWRREVKQR